MNVMGVLMLMLIAAMAMMATASSCDAAAFGAILAVY